ncbi:hypothetical protein [Methylopila sp. M107]|uniref:hypothetical protein n=1 Tax=Methylopila sp. M107 TaxID=1101190 RepID=UPI00037B961A|nr:hypothetical protein [Methylopila sp. M107]
MKPLMLSAAVALGLSALAVPANAQSVVIGGGDRGDCRMVEKRVVKANKTVVTRERVCDDNRRSYRDDSRDRYVERRDDRRERYVERRDNGPGIYIGR